MNYFIGLILVALGIYLSLHPPSGPVKEKEEFLTKYTETKAKVIGMRSSFMKPKWMTRVRYKTETSDKWEQDFRTNVDAAYKVGDSITIYFNKDNPRDFIPYYGVNFDSTPLSWSHIIFIFITGVIALCWKWIKKTF